MAAEFISWNLEGKDDGIPHLPKADLFCCPEIGNHDTWREAVSKQLRGGIGGSYITTQAPHLAVAWSKDLEIERATGLKLISGRHRDGIVLEGKHIIVMGVHLAARDRGMNARQCYEIKDWAQRIGKRGIPVVVTGDFNTGPEDAGNGFKVLTESLRWAEQPDETFCNSRYPRLDHYFGRGQVKLKANVDPAITCDLRLSDHRLLRCQVEAIGLPPTLEDTKMSRRRNRQTHLVPQNQLILEDYALPALLKKLPNRPKDTRHLYSTAGKILDDLMPEGYSEEQLHNLVFLARDEWKDPEDPRHQEFADTPGWKEGRKDTNPPAVRRREVITAPHRNAATALSTIASGSQIAAQAADKFVREHGPALSNLAGAAAVAFRAYPTLIDMFKEALKAGDPGAPTEIEIDELD